MSRIEKETEQPIEHQKMRPSHLLAFFVLVATVGVALASIYGFYFAHWRNGVAREFASIVPLPAASVDGDVIFYRDIVTMSEVIETSGDQDAEAWGQAMNFLIRQKHIEHLAEEMGETVSAKEVEAFEVDEEDLAVFLHEVHWSEDEYREYVVRPLLYAQKAEEAVMKSGAYQDEARSRIDAIEEKINAGIAFTDLAKQHSEDISASEGGQMGYVTEEDLDPGLEPLFDLQAGEISDVIETDDFFAIGYVYDVIPAYEDSDPQIGLQLITVKKDGLEAALDQFAQGASVKIFVR